MMDTLYKLIIVLLLSLCGFIVAAATVMVFYLVIRFKIAALILAVFLVVVFAGIKYSKMKINFGERT